MIELSALVIVFLVLAAVAFQPRPREVAALPPPSDDVLAKLESGHRVQAIRAYRQQTGASLLEASRVISHHAG